MSEKIYLTRNRPRKNEQNVLKITDEAMEKLIEVVEQTNMSTRQVASQIIIQAVNNDLIEFY